MVFKMKDIKKENYLMKVWNNMIGYFEDVEQDMSQQEKLRFAQGYLYSLYKCANLDVDDYIQLMNEVTNTIISIKDLF